MYRLRMTDDDQSETFDFFNGPLRLVNWGWEIKPSSMRQKARNLTYGVQYVSQGYDPVVESLSLAQFGCEDEIRETTRDLEEFLENAAAYHDDPLHANPYWLEWSTRGEPVKRSLLSGGSWSVGARPNSWGMLEHRNVSVRLALNRHPLWEDTSLTSSLSTALSSIGGTQTFTSTAGRVPARIFETEFSNDNDNTGHSTNAMTKVWAGFRPEYHGLTAFEPVWECEDSTAGGDATIDDVATAGHHNDITASNLHTALTTFTDEVLTKRLHISVYGVIGSPGDTPTDAKITLARHFAGRYLVLCRTWLSDDGGLQSATIQMRAGLEQSTYKAAYDPITITNTLPRYVELGEIQIPPPGLISKATTTAGLLEQDAWCGTFTIELWSQRNNDDTTSMDYDCLVLIPSEHFLKIDDAYIGLEVGSPAWDYTTKVYRMPNERLFGVTDFYDAAVTYDTWRAGPRVSANQWYLPIGNSMLVVAGERYYSQESTDELVVYTRWYPRWTSYRE